MDRIKGLIPLYEWKNEFILFIIPIIIIVVGIYVLKQYDRSTRKLKHNFKLNGNHSKINQVILDNAGHEKILNAYKEIIKSTIRSRSIISRINAEFTNLGQLIELKTIIKEQDLFIITQLFTTINSHNQELENRNNDIKGIMQDKSFALVLKEQKILLKVDQMVKEFIKSYNDSVFLSKYPEFLIQIDKHYKEVVELYQNLTDLFQEKLMEGINN